VTDIPAWNQATQRRLHLFGRYGITMYAISAVDMALWDLAAKREGVPLHRLLSETRRGSPAGGAAGGYRAEPAGAGPAADGSSVGSVRSEISFYASLVRYGDAVIAPRVCENALKEGFTDLKLHEITLPDIEACRNVVGAEAPISVDVNCNWSPVAARDAIPALIDLGVSWLEEPTFPPEGFAELAALRGRGLPVA